MSEKEKMDVGGFDIITNAIQSLLDEYPGLEEEEKMIFSHIGKENGIAWYPVEAGIIETTTENIIGQVKQICNYPFCIVYRSGGTSSKRKVSIKEFLEYIGCWLERKPIKVNGEIKLLTKYPELTDGREIISISRQSTAYLDNTSESNIEDWVIYITLKYKNEFTK